MLFKAEAISSFSKIFIDCSSLNLLFSDKIQDKITLITILGKRRKYNLYTTPNICSGRLYIYEQAIM